MIIFLDELSIWMNPCSGVLISLNLSFDFLIKVLLQAKLFLTHAVHKKHVHGDGIGSNAESNKEDNP